MQSKKKMIGNAVFLVVIFAVTIYGVFHGEDLDKMINAIRQVNAFWLIPGVFFALLCVWGGSIIIWYLMRSFGIDVKKRVCFLFSAVDYFFCYITPSATGGQPMQIYYMKKENIPIPVSSVVLMVVTITYKLVLVVTGIGILILGRGFTQKYLTGILPVFYLGLLLNVFCIVFMTMLLFHPVMAEKILVKGMRLLEKLHFMKKKKERLRKLRDGMQVYRETAAYLSSHKKVLVNVIWITFVQRFMLFAVTWTVYKAFGLSGTPVWEVILLQAVISISVDMLPFPGGMGISESLFLRIFPTVFQSLLLPAMVLSRGIGFYSQLLFSAVFTAVAQIYYTYRRPDAGVAVGRIQQLKKGYK